MRPVGYSTGALALSDVERALSMLEGSSATAVELSALRISELKPLLRLLGSLDLSRYDYVSFHAPSRFDAAEERAVAERAARGEVCALGLRFSEDRAVPRARFDTLRRALGDAFEVIELDSSPGNAGGFAASAHSVLTGEVRDVPGHPALAARERVVAFLHERLTG